MASARHEAAALAALRSKKAQLGLVKDQVRIVEHLPVWIELGQGVASLVHEALSDHHALVEHVGSTAVPGLAAKPILDLAVGIPGDFETNDIVVALEAAGFTYQRDLGAYGGLLFAALDEPERTLAHIHVVAVDDFQWTWYRSFRDGLRSDAQLRQAYTDLKRSAASEFAADRGSYTQAKFDWVLDVVNGLVGGDSPVSD